MGGVASRRLQGWPVLFLGMTKGMRRIGGCGLSIVLAIILIISLVGFLGSVTVARNVGLDRS